MKAKIIDITTRKRPIATTSSIATTNTSQEDAVLPIHHAPARHTTCHDAQRDAQAVDDDRFTDVANADRLVAQFGDRLRYVRQWGWLVWDGKRWKRDDLGQAMEMAKATIRALRERAERADDISLKEHAKRSESRQRLEAMLALAQSDPVIARTPDDFDREPWLLNCLNGTLDLEHGSLRLHNPADNLTKLAPVNYDPEAWHPDAWYRERGTDLPLWNTFLRDITCEDDELAGYLQRAVGYTVTGLTREAVFFMAYGSGRNGKTKFFEALIHVLGKDDYAQVLPAETFIAHYGKTIPSDVAGLQGRRFGIAEEPREGAQMNVALIKQLTGGDTVSARYMHKDFFTFTPVAKLWLGTNHKLEIGENTVALWERVKLIPFNRYFTEAERDLAMGEKLKAEAERILAWAVAGCAGWLRNGLQEPESIKESTQGYRDEQDVLADFILEKCDDETEGGTQPLPIWPCYKERSRRLYQVYEAWVFGARGQKLPEKKFFARLEQKGYRRKKEREGNMVMGLKLKDAPITSASGTARDAT